MNKYSAVIFDLDGTIVDDENLWVEAFHQVARKKGIKYPEDHEKWPKTGWALVESWKLIGQVDQAENLAILTRQEFINILGKKDSLETRPGLDNMITLLREKGYMIGLATLTHWEVTEILLNKLGLNYMFDAMTTGEEVSRPKPDPEIYLLTCQKLGVEPEEVLVFEDAEVGVESAQTAGCKVIRVGEGFDFGKAIANFD